MLQVMRALGSVAPAPEPEHEPEEPASTASEGAAGAALNQYVENWRASRGPNGAQDDPS